LGGTHLLDLDLSRVVWEYKLRPYTRMAAGSPDGRVWYAARHNLPPNPGEIEDVLKRFEDSKLRGAVRKNGFALAAWTAPHPELARRLEAARKGFVWCPGTAVRIEVASTDRDFRKAAAEKLAELMASKGFRVDPAAPLALRLDFLAPQEHTEQGKVVKR